LLAATVGSTIMANVVRNHCYEPGQVSRFCGRIYKMDMLMLLPASHSASRNGVWIHRLFHRHKKKKKPAPQLPRIQLTVVG
jgi:hypothetical protein